MTILDGSTMGLRMRAAYAVLTLFVVSACGSAPIPLIAVQGTTFVLMLPVRWSGGDMPFGSVLGGSPARPDHQRGVLVVGLCPLGQPSCAVPQYLVTRYVTAFVPDPASPAALLWPGTSEVSGVSPAYASQALALLDVPDATLPGQYSMTVRKRAFGSPQGVDETLLADVDPGSIRIVARPSGVAAAPNPTEARAGTLTFNVAPDLLKYIPYPSVALRLNDTRSQDGYYWPAAAEFEVIYPADIVIKGVFEENSPGRGSIVLMRDDPNTRTLHISLIDPRRCTPSVRIAYDWTANRATTVLPSDFTVGANTRTYDLAGQVFSSPAGSVIVSSYSINTGVVCAESPS